MISDVSLFVAVNKFLTKDAYPDWRLSMLEHKTDESREAENVKVSLGMRHKILFFKSFFFQKLRKATISYVMSVCPSAWSN